MQIAPKHQQAKGMGTQVHSNVRQITNAIIRRAMKENSSDIHIIPLEEHSTIRFRVNGELSEPIRIPISLHEQVISFFRDLAKEMFSEKTQQELDQTMRRFEVRVGALSYDMEIEERPSSHGEYIVLHVCKNRAKKEAHEEQLSLSGLHQSSRAKVIEVLNAQHGVVLLSGPFGSGKTTTMYSFLNYLHTQGKKAISFEKTIEMKIPNVTQISTGKDVHQFMSKDVFEHVAQEKPDVIMIDHISDIATAKAAFELSANGYLVISSIRAIDTSSVLSNLKAFGVSNETIGDQLKLSLCQRLMHRLCSECHKIRPADPATLVRYDLPSDTATFQPHGCRDCMGTGFSGRTPVHETCVISEEFGALLRSTVPDYEFRQIVINAGMLTLFEDALIKALEGLIPLEEVLRNLPQPTLEHTVGSRLQRMSLLPNNKNLLVSTGDAEAMINQNTPDSSEPVEQQSITQKITAAESFEEAMKAPLQRSVDTLTLTEEDLPKKVTLEAAAAAENVTPFTIKDEPIIQDPENDTSLLKTLSIQHELTDTVCLTNSPQLEKKEAATPTPRFQMPQPSFKKPEVEREQAHVEPPEAQQTQTPQQPVMESPLENHVQNHELQSNMVSQELENTAVPPVQKPWETVEITQEKTAETSSDAFDSSEALTQLNAEPTQETHQDFDVSSSHLPVTTEVDLLSEEAAVQKEAAFDVSRQDFVEHGFDEQDFDLIQNKTMRFQAARTEPVHSAAHVLNQTVRFDASRFPVQPEEQAPQNDHHAMPSRTVQHDTIQNQPTPPFQAQTPVLPVAEKSQPLKQQTTYSGVPQQPTLRNPQQTQSMPAFQQPAAPVEPMQQTQRFQATPPQAFSPTPPAFQQPAAPVEPMQQTQRFQAAPQAFSPTPPAAPTVNPAANNYSQFEAPTPQQPVNQATPEPQTRKKLLLVEDGHTIRDYISFILRSGGYDVVDVETAEEALSILFHDRPDALISDHILPGMNGTSLIATVRSHPRLCDIPTMLLTSEAKMEVEALRTGADSYLEKPVDPDLLLARLGSLLAAYDRMSS